MCMHGIRRRASRSRRKGFVSSFFTFNLRLEATRTRKAKPAGVSPKMEAVLWLLVAASFLSGCAGGLPVLEHVHTKFQFKHSFKGPYIVNSEGKIPFWSTLGSAIASDEQLRVCPSLPSSRGGAWNQAQFSHKHWMVDATLRVTGRLKHGADGMAIWFTADKNTDGPVFGNTHTWSGLGVMFDSFDNDMLHDNPKIQIVVNDGTRQYEHNSDGLRQETASCTKDFRNRPHPVKVRILYLRRTVEVWIHSGLSLVEDDYELCAKNENVNLPSGGFFGISAATGGLSDDHDVLSFLTHSLVPFEEKTEELKQMVDELASKEAQYSYREMARDFDQKREDYLKEHPDPYGSPENVYDWQKDVEMEQNLRLLGDMQVQLQMDMKKLSTKMDMLLAGGGGRGGQVGTSIQSDLQSIQTTEKNILHQLADLRAAMDRSAPQGAKIATSEQLQPVFETKAMVQQNTRHLEDISHHLKAASSGARVPKCPTPSETSCISPYWFAAVVTVQTLSVLGYILYRQSQERAAKKFF